MPKVRFNSKVNLLKTSRNDLTSDHNGVIKGTTIEQGFLKWDKTTMGCAWKFQRAEPIYGFMISFKKIDKNCLFWIANVVK